MSFFSDLFKNKSHSSYSSNYSQKQQYHLKQSPKSISKHRHLSKQFSCKLQSPTQYTVNLHSTYSLKSQHKYFYQIQTYILLANQKKSHNPYNLKHQFNLQYYPTFQFQLANSKIQQEKCTICLTQFEIKQKQSLLKQLTQKNDDDIYMLTCKHKFHLICLQQLIKQKDWVKCPVCSMIVGIMVGDQPEGQMTVEVMKSMNIPGHGNGAIMIQYRMQSGTRNGKHFSGTTRIAYLPDNKQGRQVLSLLRQAFKRKLIFTVGRSVTTGLDNQTVWNGIHHKTSISGGVASFGYPDATYLDRVKQQLAAKGITLQSLDD